MVHARVCACECVRACNVCIKIAEYQERVLVTKQPKLATNLWILLDIFSPLYQEDLHVVNFRMFL